MSTRQEDVSVILESRKSLDQCSSNCRPRTTVVHLESSGSPLRLQGKPPITCLHFNLHQNDYNFPNSSRHSALLWRERPKPSSAKSKGRSCSIALATAAFVVLVAVLSIAGLALYMGALRTEPPSPLLTFSCSVKVARGDRFVDQLQEKMRKYKSQLAALYQRSMLGPALISCAIDKFGNDTLTIYYRLTFNKRKIPRTITNIEKTIRDIMLSDAVTRKPIFKGVRFDARSINIRLVTDLDSYQRIMSKPKEQVKTRSGVLLKPTLRSNLEKPKTDLTLTARLPVLKRPIIEEVDIKEEDLPVIQGSFQISKTDADISEKKEIKIDITTMKPKNEKPNFLPRNLTVKEAAVRSSLYKIASIQHISKSTAAPTTTQSINTTKIISTVTKEMNRVQDTATTTSQQKSTNPLFTIKPQFFDQEPWKPIYKEESTTQSQISILYKKQPVYTSFTNPGLSFHSPDAETLGSTSLKSHPIPVNKLAEVTEASNWDTVKTELTTESVDKVEPTTESRSENREMSTNIEQRPDKSDFVEIKTLKYVPGSAASTNIDDVAPTSFKWEFINGTTQSTNKVVIPTKVYSDSLNANIITNQNVTDVNLRQASILKNLSTIFHNLASTLGVSPSIHNPGKITRVVVDKNQNGEEQTTRHNSKIYERKPIHNENVNKKSSKPDFEEEQIIGKGQVEVVDQDELSLIMQTQTTKLPLVTLLPAKSNSGIGRPLRRRPEAPVSGESVENRSFPDGPPQQNINIDFGPIKYIETEVVTTMSTELSKRNENKSHESNLNVIGILNFKKEHEDLEEVPSSSLDAMTNKNGIIRNAKMESTQTKYNITHDDLEQVSILNMNSTHFLTPEKLKQLSAISKLSENNTGDESVISTKAVHSTYTINHGGFKILTKTFNKLPIFKDDEKKLTVNRMEFTITTNKTECNNFTVKCGDGQCLPETTRCNQLVDCNDGVDEKNCNCADYLRSQFLLRKICDGVVDCWDFSDENHCDWCSPGQYVCGNSKLCINKNKICDGVRNCPHADDERQCVTVAPDVKAADEFPYYSEGFLLVRKYGQWGKLCVENFENVISQSQTVWELSDLGHAVCKAITYQGLESIQRVIENNTALAQRHYELAYSFRNETKSSLSFQETSCNSGKVIKVTCHALECGARPQAVKQIARRIYRVVGGGNAELGAWPWQAALYKEGEFQCGATLLSDRWLLSAGHCFYHSLEEHWVARLGALRRGTTLPSPYEQLRPIVKIILHPDYVDAGFINDISILQMGIPVAFSDYVRPICLPPLDTVLKDGTMCTVVGWGQLFEIGRIFPDTLQEVEVPVISTSECRKRTVFLPLYRVTDDMFCAGYERGGRDACLGDSGGPLMCPEPDGRWVLQGITSNGYGCARANRPGVYTKVANYLRWINSYINNENPNNSTTFTTKSLCVGHRCPLGECLPKSRLCNGFIECSDGSDEKDCLT